MYELVMIRRHSEADFTLSFGTNSIICFFCELMRNTIRGDNSVMNRLLGLFTIEPSIDYLQVWILVMLGDKAEKVTQFAALNILDLFCWGQFTHTVNLSADVSILLSCACDCLFIPS